MIISRITSGLGNQMFQYAVARSLAIRNDTSLYLDLSYYKHEYETDTPRKFKLHQFNTNYNILNNSPYLLVSKATKLIPYRTAVPFFQFIKEQQFHFDFNILNASSKFITLEGFWQSEKYFEDYKDIIRKEFTFKPKFGKTFTFYKERIIFSPNSVSLHIRRGDYVDHPEFSQTFGFIGLDYYKRALLLLSERLPRFNLFIFSDDIHWVKQNLILDIPHIFITNNSSDADLDDLQLMSLCKHHIITNSSFSWWGAWLNPDKEKIVIAPKRWFKNKPTFNTRDLLPSAWLRI